MFIISDVVLRDVDVMGGVCAEGMGCGVGVVDGVCSGCSGVSIGNGVVYMELYWMGVVSGV